VDKLPADSRALQAVEQSDQIRRAENLYHEALRPQFHFTSRRGWNNDPNGLVYFDGEYHLFYQHNPYGWNWGNMHWGHAVSPDLVHWQELGEALYPDALGTMFSGSAVVDDRNTAGFAHGDQKAIVCMYTAAGNTSRESHGQPFTQCLAYSTDRGRSWTKYQKNPVLAHIVAENRDPKVIWYEPEQKWVLALYLDKRDYALFASKDLKQWERLCSVSIPGTSECPEFFEIPVQGHPGETRWIFYGGNGRYLVGRFDGHTYTAEGEPHTLHYGNCFYASQTYNHLPASDGRRILVAWGQVNLPGMPFNQMMDFPVELTLANRGSGLRLEVNPVKEIERLRRDPFGSTIENVSAGEPPIPDIEASLFDAQADIDLGGAAEVALIIHGVPVRYSAAAGELSCLDKKAALPLRDGHVRLRLLVDRASIEIFGNDGQVYMPMGSVLDPQKSTLALSVKGGTARKVTFKGYALNSIWPPN
jgi:sucrose-6-phosphate hydrolase SacC (GH32 family)